MLKRHSLQALAALALLALGACASTPAPTDIVATAARTPQLSTLSKLIADAGLGETLAGAGPYTVFAPSDEAFKAVPAETLAKIASDKELLRSVLSFHVLPARLVSTEITNSSVKTVQGASVALSKAGSFVTVEDAVVQTPDIAATNGVIHVIDRVLTPPPAKR
jgi:uncharacterized surface protein with fasciclin (FAS1) repeats